MKNNNHKIMLMKSGRIKIICIGLTLGVLFVLTSAYLAYQYMGQTQQQRLDHLQQTVQIARNSIEPILIDYRNDVISRSHALEQVRNSIRKMVYEDHTGKNYIFMSSYEGIMLVQPFERAKELTNVWDLRDANGVYIIRSLVAAAQSQLGQGYVSYSYRRPAETSAEEKVSFVIGIPELSCYIGTGQYMADIRSSQRIYVYQIVGLSLILLIVLLFLISASTKELRNRNLLLNKAERELRGIFDNSFQFIGTLTTEGVVTRANQSSLRFISADEDDVIGKNFWETPWWRREQEKKLIQQAVRDSSKGKFCRFECKNWSDEYGVIYVDFSISPIADSHGNIVSLLAEGRDVTEQTEIRKDLIREKAFFDYVIDSLPGLFFLFKQENDQFLLKEWNSEQFEEILGYPSQELYDVPITMFVNDNKIDEFSKIMDSLFEVGRLTYEFDAVTSHGETVPILCLANYFEFDEEKYIVGTGIELTEKIKAKEEKEKLETMLVQSRKMEALGVLAGGIAHDFNNILSAVLGYAELAKAKIAIDDPVGEMQAEIISAGVRAKDLVNQILLFSRQSKLEMKPVLLESILKESLTLLRSSIPTTIEIKQSIPSGLGVVLADPTQIHQIIMNLCTNAYHAMRGSGGCLTVSLFERKIHKTDFLYSQLSLEPGAYQVLEISDTGCGMDKPTLSKIFDPYFTTKEKGDGTGLGLSVVHGIVTNYGGEVKVYSELGHGTCFQVYLPSAEEQRPVASSRQQTDLQGGTEKVLLVDDDSMILEMTKHSLTDIGYRVSAFLSGREALKVFSADPDAFDLVITDMTMPKMTGMDLSSEILNIRSNIPIILCTGHSELLTREKVLGIGVRALLMKPIFRKELSQTIREVLDDLALKGG